MPKKSKVTILAPLVPGCHLSGCTLGQYFRFLDHDTQTKERWNTRDAYQYLGREGATKSAKVLHVDSGGHRLRVPCATQITPLELVSIELRQIGSEE